MINYNSSKCHCCGYEYEVSWDYKNRKYIIVKGDEPFIRIDCLGRPFETDEYIKCDYGPDREQMVYLYGCPKCTCVHFVKDD